MKTPYWIVGVCVIVVGGFFVLNSYTYNEKQGNTSMQDATVQVIPISHATAVLRWGDVVIYTDPTGDVEAFLGQPPPTIILVTDIHGDHLSTSTLAVVIKENTTLIVPQAVKDILPENLATRARVLKNSEATAEQELKIVAMPMYNLPESSGAFHTKGRGNGYVIAGKNFRIYVAGDTGGIPEMRALTNIDIAFIPMNLPYTMGVEEAADAVLEFKPKQVYPYHYRGPDGLADVEKFKSLVNASDPNIEVVLVNWYPQQ